MCFMKGSQMSKAMLAIMAMLLLVVSSYGATVSSRRVTKSKSQITEKPGTRKKLVATRHSRPLAKRTAKGRRTRRLRHRYYERFTASSFSANQTNGDVTTGEDPLVRQAAVDALGD